MADDSHYLMVMDHRQLLDAAGRHRRPSLEDLKIGGCGDNVSGHELVNWNTGASRGCREFSIPEEWIITVLEQDA
jgi:hypothetical protein